MLLRVTLVTYTVSDVSYTCSIKKIGEKKTLVFFEKKRLYLTGSKHDYWHDTQHEDTKEKKHWDPPGIEPRSLA